MQRILFRFHVSGADVSVTQEPTEEAQVNGPNVFSKAFVTGDYPLPQGSEDILITAFKAGMGQSLEHPQAVRKLVYCNTSSMGMGFSLHDGEIPERTSASGKTFQHSQVGVVNFTPAQWACIGSHKSFCMLIGHSMNCGKQNKIAE